MVIMQLLLIIPKIQITLEVLLVMPIYSNREFLQSNFTMGRVMSFPNYGQEASIAYMYEEFAETPGHLQILGTYLEMQVQVVQ